MKATKKLTPDPITPKIRQLLFACMGLIDVVEGIKSKRWVNGCGGGRFKDTTEWSKFSIAWSELMTRLRNEAEEGDPNGSLN